MKERTHKLQDVYYRYHFNILKRGIQITCGEYIKIVQLYYKYYFYYMFRDYFISYLPLTNFGKIMILRYKSNTMRVDFGETAKQGKTIYYDNSHTNGLMYKIIFIKNNKRTPYKYIPARCLNRDLAYVLKNNLFANRDMFNNKLQTNRIH